MRLTDIAEKAIADARRQGRALTYSVNEVKDNGYPWKLSIRYLVAEPNGQEYPRKVALEWFRTQEQAERARDHLQALEDAYEEARGPCA